MVASLRVHTSGADRQRCTVKPARYSDINRIANRMRAVDALEAAACGHTPKQALIGGLRGSTLCWTARMDDRPVAMFGVSPISMIEGRGAVWFLGTDEVVKGGRELLTWGPRFIDALHDEFPVLENAVAVENRRAIRLLEAWGFCIDTEPVLVGGVPMRPFRRRVSSVDL